MGNRIAGHFRGNVVGYLALFAALGGSSYAAVRLAPGSVTTSALATGAVTHSKLAAHSVSGIDVVKRSLTASSFKPSALATLAKNLKGPSGPVGAMGPAGANGSASVVMRAQQTGGSVTGAHGASTDVPLTGGSWTQGAGDLNLITGSMQLGIPASCTGSFGNALAISVDGIPNTFAVAPTAPASTTVNIPFVISELMEPGSSTQHTITAKLGNTCTKSGEDFKVSNVKIDVVAFR